MGHWSYLQAADAAPISEASAELLRCCCCCDVTRGSLWSQECWGSLAWDVWTSTNSLGRFVQTPEALLVFLSAAYLGKMGGFWYTSSSHGLRELWLPWDSKARLELYLGIFGVQGSSTPWWWPGAQLCPMNDPKDQLGYFGSSSISVVAEPGGLAVVSLRQLFQGCGGLGLHCPPRVPQQEPIDDLGIFSPLGFGRRAAARECVCRRGMLTVPSAATAAGVTPAQPGIFTPNISTLWHS